MMSELPDEVLGIIEGYERRITALLGQLIEVRDFRLTRSGRILPREAERQILALALKLRKEALGLARYNRRIQNREFIPSPLYWLERARSQLSMQAVQEEGGQGDTPARGGGDNEAEERPASGKAQGSTASDLSSDSA